MVGNAVLVPQPPDGIALAEVLFLHHTQGVGHHRCPPTVNRAALSVPATVTLKAVIAQPGTAFPPVG